MEPMESMTMDALPEAIQRRLKAAGVESLDDAPEIEGYDSHSETPEQAAERRRLAAEARAARWQRRLPATYAAASLTDLEPEHRDPILQWVRERSALNLVLAGEIGTGKTHAAYAIGNYAVERGSRVEAWHVHDLLVAMRPDGDPYAYDRACDARLLILDDLGATKPTDWARDTMLALINHRVAHERRTVYTTNASSADLRALWEPRMVDRIMEASVSVLFKGESRRKAAW
jgi:DNA replication protein DnaC